jgi:hypothetical protein
MLGSCIGDAGWKLMDSHIECSIHEIERKAKVEVNNLDETCTPNPEVNTKLTPATQLRIIGIPIWNFMWDRKPCGKKRQQACSTEDSGVGE